MNGPATAAVCQAFRGTLGTKVVVCRPAGRPSHLVMTGLGHIVTMT
jgi:hypothetical protein